MSRLGPLSLVALLSFACSSPAGSHNSGGSGGSDEGGSGGGASGGTGGSGSGGRGGSSGGTGGRAGSGGASGGGGEAGGGSGGSGGGGGTSGSGGSTGGSGGSGTPDSGASGPEGGAAGSGGASGTTQCGTTMPNLGGFNAPESLVVGPDGTIYSCGRNATLGRFAPPYDKPENNWLTINGAQVFGIALDPKKKVLYAGARGSNKVYRIPTDDPMKFEVLASTMGGGTNGVTLGADGAVYYGDQGMGQVYRLNPDDKMTTRVTKTPVGEANGIAFAPDGRLHVLSYNPATVTRFKVDASHTEMTGTRESFPITGGKNADGIAFDKMGNAFVTAGGLYKITPDGKSMMINAAGGANVEFGAGALPCTLIMWASGSGIHTLKNDVEGSDVPWHHL